MKQVMSESRECPNEKLVSYLSCDALVDHPLRIGFYSEVHLQKLTAAIACDGLLQPIVVHALDQRRFQIVSGHYRIRAVRRLRRQQVLCVVCRGDEEEALRIFCTANLLTRGRNPIEEAHIIAALLRTRKMSLQAIGKLLGHDKSWVSRRLKLLKSLDSTMRKLLESGELLPRFAQELARLPQGNDQQRVLAVIRKHSMTKDAASEFIDWWLQASEAERTATESQRSGPLYPNLTRRATRALHTCSGLIDDLVIMLRESTDQLWWPSNEWLQFCTMMHALVIAVPHVEKGGHYAKTKQRTGD